MQSQILVFKEGKCKIHGLTKFKWYSNRYRCWICAKEKFLKDAYRKQSIRKTKIEEYKPRICSRCNFEEIKIAIDYHHIDPSIKAFSISQLGCAYSWEKTKAELDKCIPLCANCHRKEHNPVVALSDGHKWSCGGHSSTYSYKCVECCKVKRNWYNQKCKRALVQTMGGCCSYCKKQVPLAAYDFHHLDPRQKEYSVGNLIPSLKYELIAHELSKCVLLCANCHIGVESGEYGLENFKRYSRTDILEGILADCKAIGIPKKVYHCKCGKQITKRNKSCINCQDKNRINWPSVDFLLNNLFSKSYVALGKELKTSDNAIRKHLKKNNVVPPKAKDKQSIEMAIQSYIGYV